MTDRLSIKGCEDMRMLHRNKEGHRGNSDLGKECAESKEAGNDGKRRSYSHDRVDRA